MQDIKGMKDYLSDDYETVTLLNYDEELMTYEFEVIDIYGNKEYFRFDFDCSGKLPLVSMLVDGNWCIFEMLTED